MFGMVFYKSTINSECSTLYGCRYKISVFHLNFYVFPTQVICQDTTIYIKTYISFHIELIVNILTFKLELIMGYERSEILDNIE